MGPMDSSAGFKCLCNLGCLGRVHEVLSGKSVILVTFLSPNIQKYIQDEICILYWQGSTTTIVEKQPNSYLYLPQVALCMKKRFNYEALASMGLPNDYFSEMRKFAALANKSTFLDLKETWRRATWSRDDVHIAAAMGATHTIAKLVDYEGGFFNNTTNMYFCIF